MPLGVLSVAQLHAVTTFWRRLRYYGINQANSLVKLMATEYLSGKLRQGTTMSGNEVTTFIKSFKPLLPGCVVKVIIRADSEN